MTASQHPARVIDACQQRRWNHQVRDEGRDPERERNIALARLDARTSRVAPAPRATEDNDVARNLARWPRGWYVSWALAFAAGMATFAAGYLALGPMLARWFAEH